MLLCIAVRFLQPIPFVGKSVRFSVPSSKPNGIDLKVYCFAYACFPHFAHPIDMYSLP